MRQKIFVLILTATALLAGCSKHGYVRLNYPQPPLAYLPEDVYTVAIINRSLTTEEDKKGKVVEAITTGEVAGSDRLASDHCLKGVVDGAQSLVDIRFVIPNPSHYIGTGTRETPETLEWQLVEDICEANQADVLLVLETFDSNSDLVVTTAANQVGAILSGKPTQGLVIPSQARMNVQSYWRMYDPLARSVVDQYQHTSFMTFNTIDGIFPSTALSETAYFSGQEYINRFIPTYFTVRRDLYKKTKGPDKREFKAGFRRSEVANWKEAIEIWEGLVDQSNRKTSGRACLNIAVANEVLGKTDEALKWAQRSYQEYDDELGRDYAKILLRRQKIEP